MKKITVFTLGLVLLTGCYKDKAAPAPEFVLECNEVISYSDDIRLIIENSCKTQLGPGTGCHDAWIDDYSQIAGEIKKENWQTEIWVDHTMPQIPNDFGIDSLTSEEIEIMKCWINQGYPQN